MKLLNFTIIKLTCFLIIGIIISHVFPISFHLSLYISSALLILLFVCFLFARKQFIKTVWSGITAYILMLFVGVLTTSFHNQKNFSNHYSNHISIEKDSLETVTFRIREVLKPGNYYDKYVIDVLNINNETMKNINLDVLMNEYKTDTSVRTQPMLELTVLNRMK